MKIKLDLNERIITLVISITLECRKIYIDFESKIFISQLIRAVSSIGANYAESLDAITTKDRIAKLSIARKEAQESNYWIYILSKLYPSANLEMQGKELNEIIKILATIQRKIRTPR